MLNELSSLTLNTTTGVITGYIDNNETKTIEIEIVGERTLIYVLELNIICKIIF